MSDPILNRDVGASSSGVAQIFRNAISLMVQGAELIRVYTSVIVGGVPAAVQFWGPTADASVKVLSSAPSSILTCPDYHETFLAKLTATLATGKIKLPPNPVHGQKARINFTAFSATSLTFTAGGLTVTNGVTSMAKGVGTELIYYKPGTANGLWYRTL